MDNYFEPPNLLFLSGIKLDDYKPIEDIFEERLNEQTNGNDPENALEEDEYPYDKIPKSFTTLDEWPISTNLHCWECDTQHDNRPWPKPIEFLDNSKISVEGSFCSANCVARYIIVHTHSCEERLKLLDMLNIIYYQFTGKNTYSVLPAPSKTEKKRYGGELDDNQFAEKIRALDAKSGIKNHIPGSVLSEREKMITKFKKETDEPTDSVSLWELCGKKSDKKQKKVKEEKQKERKSEEEKLKNGKPKKKGSDDINTIIKSLNSNQKHKKSTDVPKSKANSKKKSEIQDDDENEEDEEDEDNDENDVDEEDEEDDNDDSNKDENDDEDGKHKGKSTEKKSTEKKSTEKKSEKSSKNSNKNSNKNSKNRKTGSV